MDLIQKQPFKRPSSIKEVLYRLEEIEFIDDENLVKDAKTEIIPEIVEETQKMRIQEEIKKVKL